MIEPNVFSIPTHTSNGFVEDVELYMISISPTVKFTGDRIKSFVTAFLT